MKVKFNWADASPIDRGHFISIFSHFSLKQNKTKPKRNKKKKKKQTRKKKKEKKPQ